MHKDIARAAFENCPPELKSALAPYVDKILWNSMVPDIVLHDWPHHEWNVHREPGDKTDAPDYIALLSNDLIFYLKDPCAHMERAAELFGQISHYLADINQPLHTDDYLDDNSGVHLLYEQDVFFKRKDLAYYPRGARFWTDIRREVQTTALKANLYYAAIMDAYLNGRGLDSVFKITNLCYSHAVSDIIDLWSTIWFTARAKEPVHLSLKLNQSQLVPGDMLRVSVSSIVTRPCLQGDLYIRLSDGNGTNKYLGANGTFTNKQVVYLQEWRPSTRKDDITFSVPITSDFSGKNFSLSVFVAVSGSDPGFPGSRLSNLAQVGFKVLTVPESITTEITDEPFLFEARSFATGDSWPVLLRRWDFIFLGEKRDNPLTKGDESRLNFLIPGRFRHVMLYLGRDRLGRPAALELQGAQGLVLARLPEGGDEPYKAFSMKHPLSIKDVYAYQNRMAKRLNAPELALLRQSGTEVLAQIDRDFAGRLPYQLEFSWSGDFSDKAIYLVDDGRENGVSCTDYLLDLLETNASICIHGARMRAKEIEHYFLYDEQGRVATVPDKWNPFPFTVTGADILNLGFHIVDPKPHVFPCDNSLETGLPVPARLVESPQFVDIETLYPVNFPKVPFAKSFDSTFSATKK